VTTTGITTTLRSTIPPRSRVLDGQLGTRPTTSQPFSEWIFTPAVPAHHTTNSYNLQYGYVDLDDLEDGEFDVVVRQSSREQGSKPGGGRVTPSTGIVLVVSIVVASLLLLAVVVLLVFYRYDGAFLASASVDSFPAGCRRYLAACALGPSADPRSATATTSPPPNATSAVADDLRASHPSKSHRLSAETVVVTSTQIKHSRVQNAANSQGVIEWYV